METSSIYDREGLMAMLVHSFCFQPSTYTLSLYDVLEHFPSLTLIQLQSCDSVSQLIQLKLQTRQTHQNKPAELISLCTDSFFKI